VADGNGGEHAPEGDGEPELQESESAIPRPALSPAHDRPWLRPWMRLPRARLGFGVALVAVLAVAWFASGRTPSRAHPAAPTTRRSSATTRATRAPSTSATLAPRVSVPAWVPGALAATCRAHGASAATVVVDCTPGRGVVGVEYRAFASVSALRAAYAELAPRVGGDGVSLCSDGRPEERSWSTITFPAHVVGRYRCALDAGRARLVWTSEPTGVLAVATRADGDLRSLYQWWATVPGPNAPE
jgi:hypothetical protein